MCGYIAMKVPHTVPSHECQPILGVQAPLWRKAMPCRVCVTLGCCRQHDQKCGPSKSAAARLETIGGLGLDPVAIAPFGTPLTWGGPNYFHDITAFMNFFRHSLVLAGNTCKNKLSRASVGLGSQILRFLTYMNQKMTHALPAKTRGAGLPSGMHSCGLPLP